MSDETCIHCGRPADDHCGFAAARRPPGCVCDAREWTDSSSLPPVCPAYISGRLDGVETNCATCEHDPACHAAVNP